MAALLEWSTFALKLLGVGAIMLGVVIATGAFAGRLKAQDFVSAFRQCRTDFDRGILIGFELLIAADILRSLVIRPRLES